MGGDDRLPLAPDVFGSVQGVEGVGGGHHRTVAALEDAADETAQVRGRAEARSDDHHVETLRQCALVTKELASASTDSGCVEGCRFTSSPAYPRGLGQTRSLVVRPPGELHSGRPGAVTNPGTITLSDERDSVHLQGRHGGDSWMLLTIFGTVHAVMVWASFLAGHRWVVSGLVAAVVGVVFGVGVSVPAAATSGSGFSDIDEAGPHRGSVEALAAEGVLAGTECGPGVFCPTEPVRRWVMAVWLVRVVDGGEVDPVWWTL